MALTELIQWPSDPISRSFHWRAGNSVHGEHRRSYEGAIGARAGRRAEEATRIESESCCIQCELGQYR
jgi:hypothetical protein